MLLLLLEDGVYRVSQGTAKVVMCAYTNVLGRPAGKLFACSFTHMPVDDLTTGECSRACCGLVSWAPGRLRGMCMSAHVTGLSGRRTGDEPMPA